MMENFTTDAINIKTYALSEADEIVVMLSKNGLIRTVAKNVKKPKSKLGGNMQLLVANKLMLRKGKNLDTICQAQAINAFSRLRANYDKLIHALYLAEIVEKLYDSECNREKIYDIFYKTLENIAQASDLTHIYYAIIRFQLNFLTLLGYGLNFKHCAYCQNEFNSDLYFSVNHQGVFCEKCLDYAQKTVKIPLKLQKFLMTLNEADVDSETEFDEKINFAVCEKCFKLLKMSIECHAPKKIKTSKILAS